MSEAGTNAAAHGKKQGTSKAGKTFRMVRNLFLVLAIAYVAAAGYMYLNQRSFIFVPTGELATPESKGLGRGDGPSRCRWRTVSRSPSGVRLRHKTGPPTVLYLHGNSRNLSDRWKRFKQICR